MITLSAPRLGGYHGEFETLEAALAKSAELLEIDPSEVVTGESGDGSITYYYASEDDRDADYDGAYTIQSTEVTG